MARTATSSADLQSGVTDDVLWLLITIYAHMTRMGFDGLREMSPVHFSVEAILLESASRDIVSRLSALDDEGKTNRSFQTLFSA